MGTLHEDICTFMVISLWIFLIMMNVRKKKLRRKSERTFYRGADKSLARPGKKQARKHVRYPRDFNNIETRAVIKCVFFPARQDAEGNSRHSDRNISLFLLLVGLRTYQHSCAFSNPPPPPKIVALVRECWKIQYSRTGQRCQYNTAHALCVLHKYGYKKTHTHTHTHNL